MTSPELGQLAKEYGDALDQPKGIGLVLILVDAATGNIGWAASIPSSNARVVMVDMLQVLLKQGGN